MTQDEMVQVQESIDAGEFSVPGTQWEWLSPLCCVAWDATTSTLTIGDAVECQVYSYSEASGLAEFLERVLPAPSSIIE